MFNRYYHILTSVHFFAKTKQTVRFALLLSTLFALLAGCQPIKSAEVALPLPTATPAPSTAQVALALPSPTDTPPSTPQVSASKSINVRSGPGTDYPVINALQTGATAEVTGKNLDESWWQVTLADGTTGWVYAPLVQAQGPVAAIAVVDAPPPPATATPTQAPTVEVENSPTPAEVVAEATAAPTPQPATTDAPSFRVIEKRLWEVYENGGWLNGESVICGEKRQLVVTVVDPNGVRINGVAVQVQYGAKEIFVTGSQGKGDGNAEFVLGSGQDVAVLRDADGREASSEVATGLVTRPDVIPFPDLIAAHYCTDQTSCESFVSNRGCYGHYSWTVTFQRNY
ncbi:MAG: SH3 domain-containing protein [Caldilineaceae bacterium]